LRKAYLDTGAGKTLIAALLIRHVLEQELLRDGHRRAVFLAPTVPLVLQQCDVLKNMLAFECDAFYGERGVDYWDVDEWHRQTANVKVCLAPNISGLFAAWRRVCRSSL